MYRYPRITLAGILFLHATIATSCRGNDTAASTPQLAEQITYSPVPTTDEAASLHTDTTYQYEFRTGESGHYKYNYDVVGTDSLGHRIVGNVSMQGKYGAGVLLDKNGNEIEVTLEWVDFGELKAEDKEGNVWDLVVD